MERIKQAIILAGGKGERLRPLTQDRPKPMVTVNDKPIIQYQVERFQQIGVTNLVISCGYKAEVIRNYFRNGADFEMSIKYAVEETPLGRGGGIKAAMKKLTPGYAQVFVMNGDILTNVDMDLMTKQHFDTGALVTMMVSPLKSPYGIVDFDAQGRVEGFREKPELPHWINGGVYIFSEAMQDLLPDIGDHETETFPKLAKDQFRVYQSHDYWRGVDTVKDRNDAEKEIKDIFPD